MIPELNIAFKEICSLLLNQDIGDMLEYEEWLKPHVPLPYPAKSTISGKEVWLPPPKSFLNKQFDGSRVVSYDEREESGKTSFSPKDLENISLSNMFNIISPIAKYVGDYRLGNCIRIEKSSGGGPGENIYYSEDAYLKVRNIAYCNYVLASEYMFGCYNTPNSSFCINCYGSNKLTRCFELEGCTSCRDCFFCHNSEGLKDCIFCFNAKNLSYAVGNVSVGKEEYTRIKKMLQEYLAKNLKNKKKLDFDIYNLGCI